MGHHLIEAIRAPLSRDNVGRWIAARAALYASGLIIPAAILAWAYVYTAIWPPQPVLQSLPPTPAPAPVIRVPSGSGPSIPIADVPPISELTGAPIVDSMGEVIGHIAAAAFDGDGKVEVIAVDNSTKESLVVSVRKFTWIYDPNIPGSVKAVSSRSEIGWSPATMGYRPPEPR